jgi:hypothetical protein
MSPLITNLLLLFMTIYGLFIAVDLLATRVVRSFIAQAGLLIGVCVLLRVTTGFPSTRRPFGGVSPELSIAIMFVCTILGISAQYLFGLRGRFSWRSLLKPLVISPIVLLPLIGSVQGSGGIQSLQLISFGFLAFQNGFFWRTVLERAQTKL